MESSERQKTISDLQANWIWAPNWVDSSAKNTAGKIVAFTREFSLSSLPSTAVLHFSADTRYKLYVNGVRAAVGPSRSSPLIWYYDTVDIASLLRSGSNEIKFLVLRYFASSRTAMPFERTSLPGLTVIGSIETDAQAIDLSSCNGWHAQVDESIVFPTGLIDDVFLHISERITPTPLLEPATPVLHGIRTLNGDISPWRLRPRSIPMPEESPVNVNTVRACESTGGIDDWKACLSGNKSLILPADSLHTLELQADVHSTAFLRWVFKSENQSQVSLKVTYSEGYELEPRSYPFFRTKADRLDATTGQIIGPYDDVTLEIPGTRTVVYEPFWFRTFRLLRLQINVGFEPVELVSFTAAQVNYPLAVKASWDNQGDPQSKQIWDVSIRTMRNCMFDGYSDCPFYEQLQYSGDSRSVGLFHYLLSGDDRLMRQAITNFAASIGTEGLTQSRFPSHVPQLIAGFSLYWILQVCDHHLFFGDTPYARSFLPRIDGVLEFFHSYVDALGLVSGLPEDVWQYVDWVTTWGATEEHPDKGVPTSGRKSNRHTYFSLLYAYVLQQASRLLRETGRPGNASEYDLRAESLLAAVRTHCYDGHFFTDSTADVADDLSYSQHCQVFAVLSGAAHPEDQARLVTEAFSKPHFSKCSYMMQFYALRAFSMAGDDAYEAYWAHVWDPWRRMLANNLTTWEEDDVRQRSDCHAWGSVPVYEYCTELAGIRPLAPGFQKVLFKPRLRLSKAVSAKVAVGSDNLATVSWRTEASGEVLVELHLDTAVQVLSVKRIEAMSREIQELRSRREGDTASSGSDPAATSRLSEEASGLSTEDNFELPEANVSLDGVLVDSQLVIEAFRVYAEFFRPQLPLLESISLHQVYQSQPFLFWTIMVIVSSHLPESPYVEIFARLHEPYLRLLKEEALSAPLPLHKIQALLYICAWPLPTDAQAKDPSWLYCGVAIQAARYMGLDREQPLPSPRTMGVLPGTARARINTWLGCFYVGTSLSLHLGLQPPINSDLDFAAIHSFLSQKTLPFEIATQVRIHLVVAKFINLLLQNSNDSVGSSLIRVINNELDALKLTLPKNQPGILKMEFSILVTKIHFYALEITKSPLDSPSREMMLQTALVAAMRIIQISATPRAGTANGLPSIRRERSLPKTYYRGLALATIFLITFFHLNPSASPEERQSAATHISLAQGVFRFCSIDPLDEYARVARMFEILSRLPPGTADPTKMRFTHRMGVSILMNATRIADEARGRPTEIPRDQSVEEPRPVFEADLRNHDLQPEMVYSTEQMSSDVEFLREFWDDSIMSMINLDAVYLPQE
ncbi:hypothetical protein AK830_g10776 [Neonectria ditissima]|uniref:Xylanolytic transcriptional activator regulatory domain-containing protein n=1 Tax=Neonectria ditissima TaxID=78410 RepID=A0A0P7B9Q2_9HYPO|nr:hypothetical protein AK830_g10776 [Neonectria ditissima]